MADSKVALVDSQCCLTPTFLAGMGTTLTLGLHIHPTESC